MLRRYIIGIALASTFIMACKSQRNTTQPDNMEGDELVFEMDEMEVRPYEESDDYEEYIGKAPEYIGAAPRVMDLVHTTLYLTPDFTTLTAKGKAILTLKPYFQAVDSFYLDAKSMKIEGVELLEDKKPTITLSHQYDGKKILIRLPRTYKRNETLKIQVHYIAQPETVVNEGGRAITDNKGLYFINPHGKEKGKARQIWTQGETESTSAWVPTIDAPNEKMTHDLFVTVDDTLMTLSNGDYMSGSREANGKRTDYWKMEKPHAPYLLALVVGKFHVEESEWRNIPLGYFMDTRYTNSAKILFKNTPEMLEFFSNKMNYPYPWPKYDQVVVDDFVSGAMENTTLSIFGEMLHLNTRELLDQDYEDVIAHELFHHWFGDLVTCESWGQLPLNESFATYGEYLWREHKYGRDNADEHRNDWLLNYLNEAEGKQVPMIRDFFESPEDMFDAHSYQKGGLILHMLRNYIGDEAFFEGLNLYLKRYEYKTAEIHNLRQCFEEVCGQDLNWFFQQWFFKEGHPRLLVNHNFYEAEAEDYHLYHIDVEQTTWDEVGTYRLPTSITFYFGDSTYTEKLDIKESTFSQTWNMTRKPLYVSFDARNSVLCQIEEIKTDAEWLATLKHSNRVMERLAALDYFIENSFDMTMVQEACNIALGDAYPTVRVKAMDLIRRLEPDEIRAFSQKIIDNAENHPKSAVRAAAFRLLAKYPLSDLLLTIDKGLADSSYRVNSATLSLLKAVDEDLAIMKAEQWALHPNDEVRITSLLILASSKKDYTNLFTQAWEMDNAYRFYTVAIINRYLMNIDDPQITLNLLNLINSFEPESDEDLYVIMYLAQCNEQVEEKWKNRLEAFENGELMSNPSPANLEKQHQMKRVLAAILHLY